MATAFPVQQTISGTRPPVVDLSAVGELWLVTVSDGVVCAAFPTVLRYPSEIREWARRSRAAVGGGTVYLVDPRGPEVPPRVGTHLEPSAILWPEAEEAAMAAERGR